MKSSEYKIIKFDFDKLKEGMEVWDIVDGWRTVDKLHSKESGYINIKLNNDKGYYPDGRHSKGDMLPRLVAMKIKLEEEK